MSNDVLMYTFSVIYGAITICSGLVNIRYIDGNCRSILERVGASNIRLDFSNRTTNDERWLQFKGVGGEAYDSRSKRRSDIFPADPIVGRNTPQIDCECRGLN